MPTKRKSLTDASSTSASKRNKLSDGTVLHESSPRRSPRKAKSSVTTGAETSADEHRRGKPGGSKPGGSKPGLKSWLLHDTKQDKKAIKAAVGAAVETLRDDSVDQNGNNKVDLKSLPVKKDDKEAGPGPQTEEQNPTTRPISPPAKKRKLTNQLQPNNVRADEGNSVKTERGKKAQTGSAGMAAPLAVRTGGLQHFIGAHVSIAKGIQNGVLNAKTIGANAFAIFLKSQRKWDNPSLADDAAKMWHAACEEHSYSAPKHVLPHGSYLVNLASQTPEQHTKSISSFLDDLERCERLGIRLYNFHPGNTNGASKAEACRKIADAINLAHSKTKSVIPVLETMASNKLTSNTIGGKFEDLAMIIKDVKDKNRVGVCIDTCHTFAAGYDIVSKDGFKKTMEHFDEVIGRQYLRAWHLNDSKAVMGSGRDLHANIGTGFIGLRGFWNVMNMDVWGKGVGVYDLPMVLETPIDEEGGGMVPPKKGEKKPKEEDRGIWAREIKLLESLVDMDPDGDDFKALEHELHVRGTAQREKMEASIDKLVAKGPKGAKTPGR